MLLNDLQLLTRIKRNDEFAFEEVHKQYYSRLYYFIFEFIPQHDLAEDIIQDTFMTLWNKRQELREDTNLGAYLFTVAKNNCLYRLRDHRYRQKLFTSNGLQTIELDLNAEILSSIDSSANIFDEIEQIIKQTMDELPPKCREVFYLSRFKDLKNREIAEALNISEKVVEKHIRRALKSFRVSLNDYLPLMAFLFIN